MVKAVAADLGDRALPRSMCSDGRQLNPKRSDMSGGGRDEWGGEGEIRGGGWERCLG